MTTKIEELNEERELLKEKLRKNRYDIMELEESEKVLDNKSIIDCLLSGTKLLDKDLCKLADYDEADTRNLIIDPILKELGWQLDGNVEIPINGGGRPDYVWKDVQTFLEAKRIGTNLDKHEEQLTRYCYNAGAFLEILTNGLEWRVYSPLKPVPTKDRLVHKLNIRNDFRKLSNLLNRENVLKCYENYVEMTGEIMADNYKEYSEKIVENKEKKDDLTDLVIQQRNALKTENVRLHQNLEDIGYIKTKVDSLTNDVKEIKEILDKIVKNMYHSPLEGVIYKKAEQFITDKLAFTIVDDKNTTSL